MPHRDSLAARRWWLAALDREAVVDRDSAYALLRRARDADPNALAIHLRYARAAAERRGARAVADEYRAMRGRGGVYPCLAVSVAAEDWTEPPGIVAELEAIARTGDPGGCATFQLAYVRSIPGFGGPRGMFDARRWAVATSVAGYSSEVWDLAARTADRFLGARSGDSLLVAGAARVAHPLARMQLRAMLAARLEARGDTGQARVLRAKAEAAARSDGRPGFLLALLLERAAELGAASAEPLLVQALALLPRRGAGTRQFSIREWRGNLRFDAGDVAAAVPEYRAALSLADSLGLAGPRPALLVRLGRAYVRMGRQDAAERALRRAIAELDPRARYTRADAHHHLGHVLEARGQRMAAMSEYDRCIALSAPLSGDGLSIIALRDAALLRSQLGMRAAARPLYEEMVRRIDARGEYQYWAGEYFERIGDLRRALRYYNAVPLSDTEEGARAAAGRVRIFEALGLFDSAAVAAAGHDRAAAAPELVRQLPRVLAHRGRWGAAVGEARTWVALQMRHANRRGESLARLELGEILLGAGDAGAAAAEARASGRLARSGRFRVEVARSELLLGRALSLGSPQRGLPHLEEAARRARALGEVELLASAELERARAFGHAGSWTRALEAYGRAATAVESRTVALDDEFDRARYGATRAAPYEEALALLIDSAPSRADLLLRWSARRKLAVSLRGPGQAERASREALPRLRATLPPDVALIDFVLLSRGDAVALVVTRRAARVVTLPTSSAAVDSLVRRVRVSVAPTFLGHVDLARLAFDTASARRLGDVLIAPIERALTLPARIVIVPDGVLSLLPFDVVVLPHEGPARGSIRFAVDRYEIGYLPAAATAAPERSYARGAVLGIAGDAPAAAEEMDALVRTWTPGGVTILSGAAATEPAIEARVPPHGIVHFAAHAEAADRDPESSVILLGPPGAGAPASRDGLLHASEVAAADWRGALVVLSGCETVVGPVFGGSGALGIARAFLAGGASSVVATQWPIGPSAATLMKRFYRELAAGQRPSQALRSAKLWLRQERGLSEPFHWAGFLWIGRAAGEVSHSGG